MRELKGKFQWEAKFWKNKGLCAAFGFSGCKPDKSLVWLFKNEANYSR